VAEGIPFIEMTQWDHHRLYDLKGQVVSAGVKAVTGLDLPVFPKRRFQHGAVEEGSTLFPSSPRRYRQMFQEIFEVRA